MDDYGILKYLKVEDFLTLAAASISLTALFYFNTGCYACGIASLLLAAIIDFFDGLIARNRNTTTDFGRNLDFLQDAITYCVAVAVLVHLTVNAWWIIYFIVLLISASLVRLARQQLVKDKEKYYVGLPVTFNLILPLMYVLGITEPTAYAGAMTILSLLMVSSAKIKFI